MTPESTFHPTQKYTLNICVLMGLMMYRKSALVPKGNQSLMSHYHSRGHTKLIVNYLKEHRHKFDIKILY